MSMTIQDAYQAIGGDFNDALGRLGSEAFVQRFAMKYLNDNTFDSLMSACQSGSVSEQFREAHNLKGLAANLSFAALHEAADRLTEQLRHQVEPADPQLLEDVRMAHQRTIEGLAAFRDQGSGQ